MARPSKLTPELQDRIIKAITAGNDNVVSAAYDEANRRPAHRSPRERYCGSGRGRIPAWLM